MKNSGCPDIENASCRFLAKAVDDVKNLPVERGCLQKFEKEIETLTSEMNKKVAEKQKKIWEIGYNPDQLKLLLIQVNGLAKYERIKATAAGIQLGMLFIDEPPFLDDEGAQAYVDALETIRDRYSDVKIMAITHDDAMKARFGQAVTVIKTDDGSKVIY